MFATVAAHATATATATATRASAASSSTFSFANIALSAQTLLSRPSWDVALVLALLAIAFFYGISTGKKKAVTAIIYTYVSFAVFSAIPSERLASIVRIPQPFFLKAALFGVIFIILMFLFGRTRTRGFARPGAWWQIFVLSVTQVGLLAHIIFGFLPQEQIATLAPLTKNFFANQDIHVWWFLGPLTLLAFFKRFTSLED